MDAENTVFTRLKNSYVATALIWLNTSIFLFLLIGGCYVYSWIRPAKVADRTHYAATARAKGLHTLSPSAARQCFMAFENLQLDMEYLYQSWVGFSERPFQSTYLNIDQADPLPLRRTISNSKDAKKTIWLFGGSTQFGWGVPDNQTIASHLSQILSKSGLRYNVVNHGHTWYYSTQEAALFANLLRHGQRCDLAVFLDGLNDNVTWGDVPHFADRMAFGFIKEEKSAADQSEKQVIVTPAFPPVRLLDRLLKRQAPAGSAATPPDYNPADIYQFNFMAVEKMAETANIKMAAFWQPTPFDYMTGAEQNRKTDPILERIPKSNALVRQRIKSNNFHFIADLFQHDDFEDIYVDQVHYGDKGNRLVAEAIAAGLKSAGLLQGD
jgi:lysophospholipase L1-like esterase